MEKEKRGRKGLLLLCVSMWNPVLQSSLIIPFDPGAREKNNTGLLKVKNVTLAVFCSVWVLVSSPSFCLKSSSNFFMLCWLLCAWAFCFSSSLCRCLTEKSSQTIFKHQETTTLETILVFINQILDHQPDLLLNISWEEVGSGLISCVIAVSEDLISLLWKGLEAVLWRVSALHHSPSFCTVLQNKHMYSKTQGSCPGTKPLRVTFLDYCCFAIHASLHRVNALYTKSVSNTSDRCHLNTWLHIIVFLRLFFSEATYLNE